MGGCIAYARSHRYLIAICSGDIECQTNVRLPIKFSTLEDCVLEICEVFPDYDYIGKGFVK